MKSFKMVLIENSGNECGNGLRFATEAQAHEYHADLYSRWTGCPSGYRIDPSEDPVSAKYSAAADPNTVVQESEAATDPDPAVRAASTLDRAGLIAAAAEARKLDPYQCDDNGDRC